MSQTTFKNARPQRKYRERGQLFKRQHLGLLEKHQDYKERAVNYHRKQDKLKNLQLKAALKNKDEFHFKMIKGQLKDGKHIDPNESEEEDQDFDENEFKKIVKTQSQGLLKVQYHRLEKKVDRLQSELHSLSKPPENSHKFFVEQPKEFEIPDHLKYNKKNEENKQQYLKLNEAIKKKEKMKGFFLKLDYQKGLLGKEKRKIKKYKTGKVFRFQYERKR